MSIEGSHSLFHGQILSTLNSMQTISFFAVKLGLCKFDAHKGYILDGFGTQGVECTCRDSEVLRKGIKIGISQNTCSTDSSAYSETTLLPKSTRLRICFNSYQTTHIDIVSVQILRTRAECGCPRNSPRSRITALASSEFQSFCYYTSNSLHVFLIDWWCIRRSLYNLLTFPILTLETLPSLHESARFQSHRFHKAGRHYGKSQRVFVPCSVLSIKNDSHCGRVVEWCSNFYQ